MTNALKKTIMVLVIFTIIIILVLFLILTQLQKETISENTPIDETETLENAYEFEKNKIKSVKLRTEYFLVKSCIETFYNNYSTYMLTGNNSDKVYNLLDNKYIEMFQIAENSLRNKFGNGDNIEIDLTNMYSVQLSMEETLYLAYGYVIDVKSSKISNLAMGVKVDNVNNVFSILPYEYLEKKQYLNITENTEKTFDENEKIENKTYNICQSFHINDETYVNKLLENYLNRALYNINLAYQTLDSEYCEKKYGNIQKYNDYINKNRNVYLTYNMKNAKSPQDFNDIQEYLLYLDTFKKIELESFKVTEKKDYTQYICIDNLNNYYIFKEIAPMQYTIILDNYTIDLPEFIEKYNAASQQEKVTMNIEKIIEALNKQDYEYVYGKLNNSFRTNNFANINKFIEYINTKFYSINDVEYRSYTQEGNTYICNITIKDMKNENNKKELTILVRLNQETDFEISFAI